MGVRPVMGKSPKRALAAARWLASEPLHASMYACTSGKSSSRYGFPKETTTWGTPTSSSSWMNATSSSGTATEPEYETAVT